MIWGLCGVMVSALACDSRGRKFDFQPFHCYVPSSHLAQVIHTRASVAKLYNLVPAAGSIVLRLGR